MQIFTKSKQVFNGLEFRDRVLVVFSTSVSIIVLMASLFLPKDAEQYYALGYIGVALSNLLNSATVFSPLPAFVVTFFAAKLLNPVILIILSAIVTTTGESVIYMLGDGLDSLVKEKSWHKKLREWFYKSPFIFLVIWVALPNPVQSFGQIFAGSAAYPFWKYTLAIFIGNLIWFTLVVNFGQWFFEIGIV